MISSVHPDDSGMYQCFASNDLYSTQDSSQLRLGCKTGFFICFAFFKMQYISSYTNIFLCLILSFLAILPKLMYRFSEQTLQPGPSVSLKCTAVGNPPPQFQWTLDGFPLPENER